MKVLVTGSRYYTDNETILRAILTLEEPVDMIIHGGAKGADTLANGVAEYLDIPVTVFPAKWDQYGVAAGAVRNSVMLKELDKSRDIVLAFHEDIDKSKGTRDMITKSVRAKIRTILYKDWKSSQIYLYYPAILF